MADPYRQGAVNAGPDKRSVRRQELLELSARLFATKGYANTTVRDIAQEAGILSGSLYHHFESKEEIFHEVIRSFLAELHRSTQAAVQESDSARDLVDRLVADSFEAIEHNRNAVALYQNEARTLARQPQFAYLEAASAEIEAVWLEAITHGQQSGEFRSDLDPRLVYRFVRDMSWSSVRWYRPEGTIDAAEIVRQFTGLLHGGLDA